ncbi:MAG: hypothetical protein U0L92_01585 [Clostridia bacterium]|nr:hypothetical protein [Clostridia bacterium]
MSKKQQKMTRHERNEHLTNWYMINLSWGIVGILALLAIKHGYQNINLILKMQPIVWVLTGIFAAGTIALVILGKVKNSTRANHYAFLTGACTFVSLWLAFYNKIRLVLENVARTLLGNPNLTVSSYWNVWIPMIGIGLYLVVAFIYYAIKLAQK